MVQGEDFFALIFHHSKESEQSQGLSRRVKEAELLYHVPACTIEQFSCFSLLLSLL